MLDERFVLCLALPVPKSPHKNIIITLGGEKAAHAAQRQSVYGGAKLPPDQDPPQPAYTAERIRRMEL